MQFDRREFLARTAMSGAAIGAGGASLLPLADQASAKAPLAGTPSAGVFRFKLGEFEVTALNEGVASRPLDASFIKNADLKDVHAVLTENHLPTDKLNITFTPLVVNTGSKVVLFDTGFADNGGATNGRTVAQLKAAGIQPEQVDEIVISHFHGDHISGIRGKDGKLVYPNAQILVPEVEWNHWMDDAVMAARPEAARGGFVNARRVFSPIAADVKKFKWGSEPTTGVTAVDASGHTPGHTAYVISSGNAKLMYVADLTNNPVLFARHPDWSAIFDEDAAKAVASRRRILDMAATEKLQLSFYHANFPATGFVTKQGNGFTYVPASWNS